MITISFALRAILAWPCILLDCGLWCRSDLSSEELQNEDRRARSLSSDDSFQASSSDTYVATELIVR